MAMVRIPSLDALRVFVVAARHLSFTEAADHLHLTQSAISHRMRGLEDVLGISLFNRLTSGLELTAQGRALARRIELAIGEIDRSVVELTQRDDTGPVKVTMSPAVASHWLIPRLPSIRNRYPDLDVQVIADHQPLNLRARGIDLAIRFCRAPQPDYAMTRLMGDRIIPVCAPALLERHGPVATIDELLSLPLLDDSSTRAGDSGSDWRAWLDHHGRPDADYHTRQRFSDAGMLIDAAGLGLGVALARVSLVADRLASGALVCPLRLAAPTPFSYYLLCLPEAVDRPKIALFRSILISEAALTEASILAVDRPLLTPFNADYALAAAA
jgi:LysR family transcriptional regulator, glycine cleavage system transcriptional activator